MQIILPELLKAWRRVGVPGATILPSAGVHDTENSARRGGLSNFLHLFDQGKSPQRTIISIIDDHEMLEVAIAEADRVVKGFDSPKSGILFTLPLGQVLGLQKWGQPQREQEPKEEPDPEEKSEARLLQWFEEDVKGRYGEEALQDWSRQRNIPSLRNSPLIKFTAHHCKNEHPPYRSIDRFTRQPWGSRCLRCEQRRSPDGRNHDQIPGRCDDDSSDARGLY